MTDISTIVIALKQERDRIDAAIQALEETSGGKKSIISDKPARKGRRGRRRRRKLSAAAKRRLSEAAKARWARAKKAGRNTL